MNPKKAKPLQMIEVERDPSVLKGRERNIQMFADYFKGMRPSDIARKYGVSRGRITNIKKRDRWNQLSEEIRDRAYAAMSYEWKDFLGKITFTLKKDWERMAKKTEGESPQLLTSDERTHGRALLDYLVKASKLADDKPMGNAATDGTVTHRVILPEGVKRYGVIPPDSKVQQIEHTETKKEKPKITVEDVTDDID